MKVSEKALTLRLIILAVTVLSWWFHACNTIEPEPPLPPLDTTSHNFAWTVQTLGDGNSSVLYDVAIVNDSLAYAVGEVYLRDSSGGFDPLPYNLANWNAKHWEVKRATVLYRGSNITPPLYAVFVLSPAEIWLSAGVPIFGDGQTWTQYHLFDMGVLTQNDGSILKLWASSPSNAYFVGNRGTIVHYDGNNWQKLASGTTLTVRDIYGSVNPQSGALQVLAVASDPLSSTDRAIFEITGSTVRPVSDAPIVWSVSTVWFVPGQRYYVAGSGIYERHLLSDPLWQNGPLDITHYYIEGIRGNALNDIFAVGGFGEVLHYNGATWRSFKTVTGLANGNYHAVAVRGNLVIAVGIESGAGAVIAVGRRQP
ncbi:MAG: glucosyl transferase [Bacteroidota bacterium]